MLDALNKSYIAGLTFSGGDPLHPNNIKIVTMLAQEVKEKFPDKNIWLYTGYEWDEIKDYAIMNYIDVVVEGKFIQEQKNISLKWCGSSNQRIVNVKKSKENNTIVQWEQQQKLASAGFFYCVGRKFDATITIVVSVNIVFYNFFYTEGS